ncbi:thiamine biosynthesis protein ThiS [Bacillus lacus]|uniref:Thiamine biosynthesis protein ThiS n=1 Tax=Metabacillus lacus TaxID=1983721 RepID=A0A7X2J1H0_9BACI|nr:sulfur carrier protein ThiS [Metabacillus lacus]MRX73711.1 thiamine biosynthesis protein ThiS [Metabacillus lacus]
MNIVVNGEAITLPEHVSTAKNLLEHFQLEDRIAIIERNAEIVDKNAYDSTVLSNGDKIEIVHFVGGG